MNDRTDKLEIDKAKLRLSQDMSIGLKQSADRVPLPNTEPRGHLMRIEEFMPSGKVNRDGKLQSLEVVLNTGSQTQNSRHRLTD